MWPCHNLLSEMCQDLYLSAKALKKALSFPRLSFFVRLLVARERILCVTFIIHLYCQTNAAFVWMDVMDSLLRLCCDTAKKKKMERWHSR